MNNYKFNPKNYGFEDVSNYPELSYEIPLETGKWFIKIVEYANYGGLVYWYKAIYTGIGFDSGDDRLCIYRGSYDSRKSPNKQSDLSVEYLGLISSDNFAKEILKNLLGTITNDSVEKCGKQRLNENKGKQMKSESFYQNKE